MPEKTIRIRDRSIWSLLPFLLLVVGMVNFLPCANSEQPAVTVIVVHAKRFAFAPNAITLKKGQTAKLILISDDVRHGLAVKGLGVRADIVPGKQTEVVVTPTQTGDYPGTCSVYCGYGHRDMDFMVHVVE